MADITKIPTEEMEKDRADALEFIRTCNVLLTLGITRFNDGESIKEARDIDRRTVKKIEAELARRKADDEA